MIVQPLVWWRRFYNDKNSDKQSKIAIRSAQLKNAKDVKNLHSTSPALAMTHSMSYMEGVRRKAGYGDKRPTQ
jgi:hypothetical protein